MTESKALMDPMARKALGWRDLVVIAGNPNARFTGENAEGKRRSVIINLLGPKLWFDESSSMRSTWPQTTLLRVFKNPSQLPSGPLRQPWSNDVSPQAC
jgi:hypothetical protein